MNELSPRHTPVSSSVGRMGGIRHLFEFANGYGASVIHNSMSYGAHEGLWEVAVLKDGELCYDTPVTSDVVGWLTPDGVAEVLDQIAALPEVKR